MTTDSTIALVQAVRTGRVQTNHWDGREVRSAGEKQSHPGACALGALGFEGDEQADRRHHGGPDKAVLVYAGHNYRRWADEYGLAIRAGGFFENITLAGTASGPAPDESAVRLGEIWRLGSATVQVSQHRSPCYKLARRWQVPDLVEHAQRTGWTGWYLRVLEAGEVGAGDAVVLLDRPAENPTIAELTRVLNRDRTDLPGIRALLARPGLPILVRTRLQRRLAGELEDDSARIHGPAS